jgi:cathepsin L
MGKLVPLSEQQLVDCSTMGCTGGTVNQAFKEIAKMGGLESEASYPYGPPGACRFDPTKIVAKVTGFVDLPSGVENALEQAVATIGPIPVAIDASHSSFQLYKRGGIYFP